MDIDTCKKVFGERLAELRKDSNIKQFRLAQELDISRDMLSNYERGIYATPDDIKIKIANYFNVSLDYLMGLTGDQISYKRNDVYVLPKDFPIKSVEKLAEFVNLLMIEHKSKE